MVTFLANLEDEFILKEHKSRNNKQRQGIPDTTPEEKFKKFELIPMYDRDIEHYINPTKPNWRSRYYKALFPENVEIISVCIHYLRGLEWTMKYYTTGCPNWRYKYPYAYPPLLRDLAMFIPINNVELVPYVPPNPVSDIVQLCYVLPRTSLNLLPSALQMQLLKSKDHWYKGNCEFIWAYCRYFWESHVDMADIDIQELEQFIEENRRLLV